ncbi:MAG: VWA domain-containing protein [Clostridia bacterium]|nr:VWA domain-containing protein [Clostridia bacterium]
MKRIVKKTLSLLMCIMMLCGCIFTINVNAEDDSGDLYDDGKMNLDVVFVLDASGSMLYSDPNQVALDAFNLFVDLCDDSCGVGYDVYTEKIKASSDIISFSSKSNLEKMKKNISALSYDPNGDTDIALGLTKAMNIFSKQKSEDKNRKKAIILLSDGNTHLLNGPRTVADSKKEMQSTLKSLKDKSIPVYSIGLNYDGTLDKKEIQNISKKTNGKSYETNTSDRLTGILSDIFSDIYDLGGTDCEIKDGNVEINVKDNSVFYVNIIIRTKLTAEELNPVLTTPSGKKASLTGSDDIKMTSTNSYTLIKLIYPESGKWNLHLNNATSDNCSVKQLDFYSVYVKQNISKKAAVGESVTIEASLNESDGIVDDMQLLKTIEMVSTISGKNGDTEVALTREPNGKFTGEFTPEEEGEFEIKTVASSEKFKKESTVFKLTVTEAVEEDSQAESSLTSSDSEEQEDGFFQTLAFILITAFFVIVVFVVAFIVVGIIRARNEQRLLQSVQHVEEDKPKPKPQPIEKVKPQPKPKDPDYVDIPVIEHDALENLIKRGSDDAFNKNADDYQADTSLEKLIKKGADDPFNMNADNYEVDQSLAALIKTGGDSLGDKIQPEEKNPTEDDDDDSE